MLSESATMKSFSVQSSIRSSMSNDSGVTEITKLSSEGNYSGSLFHDSGIGDTDTDGPNTCDDMEERDRSGIISPCNLMENCPLQKNSIDLSNEVYSKKLLQLKEMKEMAQRVSHT